MSPRVLTHNSTIQHSAERIKENKQPLAIAFILLCAVMRSVQGVHFEDVSQQAGIDWGHHPRLKFGGACVADLNADGWPDLLFSHHGRAPVQLYFNRMNGTFSKSAWISWADVHGMTPVRLRASNRDMHVVLSRGGSNGNRPSPPIVLSVSPDGQVTEYDGSLGLAKAAGRGRAALPIALRPLSMPGLHVIITNYGKNAVFKSTEGKFVPVRKHAFEALESFEGTYMFAIGLREPYLQDIVAWPQLTAFRRKKGVMTDVTSEVFPVSLNRRAITAVAELDFDNDGRLDLFIARSSTGDNSWLRERLSGIEVSDSLLRNAGNGSYIDVSHQSGIPRSLETRGVTVGDFDNDGWTDMFVSVYEGRDLFLRNRGDGTFETLNAPWEKRGDAVGDMVTAVDLNRDGRLDVVVSEGDWFKEGRGGAYRLLRNQLVGDHQFHFLLIRVGASPKGKATSLHAVATVISEGRVLIRKVGSPGTAVCNSWIELLHFGIGHSHPLHSVSVRWSDGAILTRRNVPVGMPDPIIFGYIPNSAFPPAMYNFS